MKLHLPKIEEERKAFLRQGMVNTVMFNGLMGDISRQGYTEQMGQLEYILSLEMKRKEGARRSIAKRIHGRVCSVRSHLEWELIEESIRA